MSWNKDLQFSKDFEIIQDNIYIKLFNVLDITRFNYSENNILDRKYHIDVELKLKNDIKLLGQEKVLRNQFIKFNTFTMEFYQNRYTKEKGEFFNIGAQFYLHGYSNKEKTDYEKWYIIKLFDFLEELKKTNIEILESLTRASTSNASFIQFKYEMIPKKFIYAKKENDIVYKYNPLINDFEILK